MASKLGQWSFIVGIIIAAVIGLFSNSIDQKTSGWLVLLLIVLGLLVGFLNISEKESTPFLIAAVALIVTSGAGATISMIPKIGVYLTQVVTQIGVFVTPAAILVAVKSIWALAKD